MLLVNKHCLINYWYIHITVHRYMYRHFALQQWLNCQGPVTYYVIELISCQSPGITDDTCIEFGDDDFKQNHCSFYYLKFVLTSGFCYCDSSHNYFDGNNDLILWGHNMSDGTGHKSPDCSACSNQFMANIVCT